MNTVLQEILISNEVQDMNGVKRPLHSQTDNEQGLLIAEIIKEIKPTLTIEIGLAYGISSLYILDALKDIQKKNHIIIEPYPDIYWDNIGLQNIERAGYSEKIDFYKDFSFNIIPKLYLQGEKIQFAYIDSTKVFDIILSDIFYLHKMLQIGGVLVLDDTSFPSLRKIARFMAKLPNMEIYKVYKPDLLSWKKKIGLYLSEQILKLVPFKSHQFKDQDLISDIRNGINYHCIAFKKTAEDTRNWDWFEKF